jgi:Cu+-exporting ATPase
MHYIPESTTEMLRGESGGDLTARSSFHYQSAPLYLLTLVVAGLLVADWVLTLGRPAASLNGVTASLFGYRLALLAAVLGGARILYHTLDGLLSGRVGADLALTLACLAAIALGEHQTAGLVVLISLIGESLEGYTIDRARWAVRQTFALWPDIVHLNRDGQDQDIAIDEVRVGDIVTIRPGERVPVDGQVVAGKSVVDQSPFTGESLPVDKRPGDRVLAGTLNQFGALTVVAESIGQSTALAHIAQLVGTAAARKCELERTADRLARWFLPVVLVAALATLFGWRIASGSWQKGFLPALGVLVVACPCPLVLATPCAVMASLAWLARRGVIIKGSAVLERLATVDTFAFDKTGTLTQNALALGQIIPMGGRTEREVLRIAAIAEWNSEHPIGRIVVKGAEERGIVIPHPTEFEAMTGAGVSAVIATSAISSQFATEQRPGFSLNPNPSLSPSPTPNPNPNPEFFGSDRPQTTSLNPANDASHPGDDDEPLSTIVVGNRRALDHGEILFSRDVALLLSEREAAGESPLVVAVDEQVIGVIGVRETIRPESQQVLEELRELGIARFVLLTGDRPQPADAVVKSLGFFDHVATEQLPADKARWVEEARRGGRRVAMIGDGVNDAPALAAADVGLALGTASGDIAAAAGDIVLAGDPLRPLPGLVRLSRALVQNIWQSISLFAFGLNGLGVLACAVGWLDPIGGAMFHEVASLAVMANAMRMLWFESHSSSITAGFVKRFLWGADWLVANASPSNWVFWLLEHARMGAKLAAAAVLAAWLLSGLVLLNEDEQAIVTRFGRLHDPLSAGLHWRWPWPLESVRREKTGLMRSVSVGYREANSAEKTGTPDSMVAASVKRAGEGLTKWTGLTGLTGTSLRSELGRKRERPTVEWTSVHEDRAHTTLAEESVMLTADEVPVELMAEIQYRIADLREFVYAGSERPDDVLRATAESVLREVAATATLDNLLTEQRASLERRSLEKLRTRIAQYKLGVEIVDLEWLDVHPPQAVVPAYRQVADALEDRELLINEAEAYASRTLLGVVGERALSLLQGEAQADLPLATHSATRTDWKLSDELWRRLLETDAEGRMRLSGSAAAILLEGQSASILHEQTARGNSERFLKLFSESRLNPELTRQHLYWTAITEILSKRTLTIIDPEAAGRQHLWMSNPVPELMGPALPGDSLKRP